MSKQLSLGTVFNGKDFPKICLKTVSISVLLYPLPPLQTPTPQALSYIYKCTLVRFTTFMRNFTKCPLALILT